jgi:hypothetical protein
VGVIKEGDHHRYGERERETDAESQVLKKRLPISPFILSTTFMGLSRDNIWQEVIKKGQRTSCQMLSRLGFCDDNNVYNE